MNTVFSIIQKVDKKNTPVATLVYESIQDGLNNMDFVMKDNITKEVCDLICNIITKKSSEEILIASAQLFVEEFLQTA